MAYGYAKGFVIEKDDTLRLRVNCKDCIFYNRDDLSCAKTSKYMPEDGYMHWRKCEHFELDMSVSNADKKLERALRLRNGSVKLSKRVSMETTVVRKGANENKKVISSFEQINDRYKQLFYQCSNGNREAFVRLCKIVPADMYNGYYHAVKGDKIIFREALEKWVISMSHASPSKKFKKHMEKDVFDVISKGVSKKPANKYGRITSAEFDEVFVKGVTQYLVNNDLLKYYN